MDRRAEIESANITGLVAVIVFVSAVAGGITTVAVTLFGLTNGSGAYLAWSLPGLALSGLAFVWAIRTVSKCDAVLDREFVDHEGEVAICGQTGAGECVLVFVDGYGVKLQMNLILPRGTHAVVRRNGRNRVTAVDVQTAPPPGSA